MEAVRHKLIDQKDLEAYYFIPSLLMVRSSPNKRPMIAAVRKGKGVKASDSRRASYGKRLARQFSVLPPFQSVAKKVADLLEQWVKDLVIRLLKVEFSLHSQIKRMEAIVRIVEERAIHWNSVSASKKKSL